MKINPPLGCSRGTLKQSLAKLLDLECFDSQLVPVRHAVAKHQQLRLG